MKHQTLSLLLFLALSAGLHGQNTMSSPIDLGPKSSSFTYSNTQNTANYTNNYSGRPSNDVFYKFTLEVPMEVVIHHCGSELNDTYVHLLNASGSLIVSMDDYTGANQCSNTLHPVLKRELAAGTYYVVSEGYNFNGNITTTITGTAGAASSGTVDIGTKSASFSYTDTKNTSTTGNNYAVRTPNDVLYRFTLTVPMFIAATHCGSELSDTYMHLLDASQNVITYNDDYTGEGRCSNSNHSVIRRELSAGTYYIVSEGYNAGGIITTNITGTVVNSGISVTGVSLNQTSLSLTSISQTAQLTATVSPSNASNQSVTWSSSNAAIASVSSTGLVTAVAAGTATITVTTVDGNRTAVCAVTVNVGTSGSGTVDIGTKSASFTYTDTRNTSTTGNNYTGRSPNDVLYRFTLTVPMFIAATHCGSELSDTYMHLLDASQNVIAYNDDYRGEGHCPNIDQSVIRYELSAGTYYIVSEGYNSNGNITTNITGTIVNSGIPVTGVSLNQTSLSLTSISQTAQLTATVSPSNASNQSVTWSSSNAAIVSVLSTGLVTAVAAGTATVTVTTADGNRTSSCAVTVNVGTSGSGTVDIGTKSTGFTYTDTRNTSTTGNNYTARNPNDVLYRFTLTVPMSIEATHCGSVLNDTYMTLLDASQNVITYNDDYTGEGRCSNTLHSIIRRELSSGTYYIVSEGYSSSGSITTTITGAIPSPPPPVYTYTYSFNPNGGEFTFMIGADPGDYPAGTVITLPDNVTPRSGYSFVGFTSPAWTGTKNLGNTFTMPAENLTVTAGWRMIPIELPPYVRLSPVSATPSGNQNYIRTRTYTSEDGSYFMDAVQYFDGLGRPSQSVQAGISPNQQDWVSLQEYDAFGRESKAWLPAIAANNRGAFVSDFQSKSTATYNNTSHNAVADSKPYAYPVYEPSPLNRVVQQYGPGQSWQNSGKAVNTDFLTNSTYSGFSTCICPYYYVSGDNIVRSSDYGAGQLYVTRTIDEEGTGIHYEFKDKQGRVVLQRQTDGSEQHDTYYVYDDYNNLRYVLPPMITVGSYTESSAAIRNYAYVYKYDHRNRCIYKKLPGCEAVYYVYDRADRLIFSQDGEQRIAGQWLFLISDELGRVVLTGTCNNSMSPNSSVNEVVKATHPVNSYPTNSYKGYTVSGITLLNPKLLTVNYYDDYSFTGNNGIPNTAFDTGKGGGFNRQYTGGYKGLLTGTLTAVLDGSSSPSYLYSVMFYDYKGQVIQSVTNNHLGGTDRDYLVYSFSGQVLMRLREHTVPGRDVLTERYEYDYDHAERPVRTVYRQIVERPVEMSQNEYDELGRLKAVRPYGLDNFRSAYAYNVRSWVSQINSNSYREDLTYRYNGNVETMQWMQDGTTRRYAFGYDGLSRLRTATNSPASENLSVAYNYDKHGNLTTLTRGGQDNLTFNYNGSNQLYNVHDYVANSVSSSVYEFKNYSMGSGQEYRYNANGAMTKDLNRGISEIAYNVLNQPLRVDIKSPVAEARNEYVYSAGGQKLRVVQRWNPVYSMTPIIGSGVATDLLTSSKTVDYVGNIIYENGVLKRILTDNGYYENGNYYFYVQNHLGSNVLVVRRDGYIVQSNHYYPFGLTMSFSSSQGVQPYKYTGKELDMEHGLMQYDFEARQYDPAVGRFMMPDPLAEKYYSISPYVYCNNNPVRFVDLHGDSITFIQDNVRYEYNNGAFWTSNGMQYTPKEGSVFSTVLTAYNKILNSSDKDLISQLVTLEKSEKRHLISEGGGGSYVIARELSLPHSEQDRMVLEGKPVKTFTQFDFSTEQKEKYKNDEGVEYSEFGMIVHEMQHQYDFDQGKMRDAIYNVRGAKKPQEIRAVKNENKARRMEGLPARTTYGGLKIKF